MIGSLLVVAALLTHPPEAPLTAGADQPPPVASAEAVDPTRVTVLADERRRHRLARLLDSLVRDGSALEASGESSNYAACLSAWRRNPVQAAACVQSRMGSRRDAAVFIHTFEPSARDGETIVTCIGSGGRHLANFGPEESSGDALALRACIADARRAGRAYAADTRDLRFSNDLVSADPAEARMRAQAVLEIALDHVGVPRGLIGTCHVQGRVIAAASGAGIAPHGRIELSIPCAAGVDQGGQRMIRMSELAEGSFARIYLSDRHELLDFVRLAE